MFPLSGAAWRGRIHYETREPGGGVGAPSQTSSPDLLEKFEELRGAHLKVNSLDGKRIALLTRLVLDHAETFGGIGPAGKTICLHLHSECAA